MNARIKALLIVLFCTVSLKISAQNQYLFENLKFKNDSTDTVYEYIINTKSGANYVGELLEIKFQKLKILTQEAGQLEISLENITSIDPSKSNPQWSEENDISSQYPSMPGSGHYFISPSAHTLEQGEGEIQFTYIFFASGTIGLSKNFSLTGGFSIFPGVDIDDQVLFFIPRYSGQIAPNVRLGGQLIYFTAFEDDLALTSITASFGDEHRNLGVGLSYGLSNGQLIRIPMINLAGVYRVSNSIALLTDNFIATDDAFDSGGGLFSFGVRLITGKGAFDFGIFAIEEASWPYVNYTLRF